MGSEELYKKIDLGRPAVFYLPSVKLKDPDKNLEKDLNKFLIDEFDSYTAEHGNIFGFWKGKKKIYYDEHVRYTVAFKGKERIPVLEKKIAEIAKKMGEEAIYLETGEDSWLIEPV